MRYLGFLVAVALVGACSSSSTSGSGGVGGGGAGGAGGTAGLAGATGAAGGGTAGVTGGAGGGTAGVTGSTGGAAGTAAGGATVSGTGGTGAGGHAGSGAGGTGTGGAGVTHCDVGGGTPVCYEYSADYTANRAAGCAALSGTYATGPCDHTGSSGGCKRSVPSQGSETTFYYMPSVTPADVMVQCVNDANATYVAP